MFSISNVIERDAVREIEAFMHQGWRTYTMPLWASGWAGSMLIMRRDTHEIRVWRRPDGIAEVEIDDVLIDIKANTKIAVYLRSLMPADAVGME
ncbi:MAG: hypothetical protein ABF990_05110 [Acetobacter sp.]|uniref:hypothetical protein n=1 Tax=Acetobacter sp. TaxID=440 RepID=UPI0039ECCDBD